MAINRAQLRKQLEPGLNTIFGLEYKRLPEQWKELFEMDSSNRAFEEDQLMSGFGAAAIKAEGSGIQYDTASEAWTARYTMQTVGLAFSITEEAQDDNLYGNIGKKYTKALVRSLKHKKEILGANIFNNAFNSSYTGGDAKELLATDHPLAGGGTFANELATPADLSETALEDAYIAICGFVDERGIPQMIRPKSLVIPKELVFEAERLLNTTGRVGTADNDINALKSTGVIPGAPIVNNYLTDTDAWFILTDCMDGLKHFNRRSIRTKMDTEFNTGDFKYKADERYAFGWTDPRGIFGSAGA
jgi:hypothetical protein